jgi:hypothetical protein
MSDDPQEEFIPDPITDEERRRDAESEALIRKISEEDPGYWDWLTALPLKSKLKAVVFR